jgi:heme A synthase
MLPTSRAFRLFSLWTAAITFVLIVIGGVVRVTGSGDACPDWPLCHGTVIPPLEVRVWIEWTHRLTNTLVAPSILALAVWVTLRYRSQTLIRRSAWLAFVLLVVQIVLGGLVVIFGLPAALVGIHLANALLIWSAVLLVALSVFRPWASVAPQANPRLRRLILASAVAVYILLFSGTVVTGTQSNIACFGWPLCSGGLLPQNLNQLVNITHRYLAALLGILLVYTLVQTLRAGRALPPLRRAAHAAIGLFFAQIIVGAINVLTLFTPFWNALHLLMAAATWGGMFVLVVVAWNCLGGQTAPGAARSGVSLGQPISPSAPGR